MLFCFKCGQELAVDAKFCPKCGRGVDVGIEESMEAAFEKAGEQMEKAFEEAGEAIRRAFTKTDRVKKEEFEVSGSELVDKVKELVHEGNVRRVIVKDQQGRTLMEFPLTVGVIGAVLAPILAALGAIATLAMKYTIAVERTKE